MISFHWGWGGETRGVTGGKSQSDKLKRKGEIRKGKKGRERTLRGRTSQKKPEEDPPCREAKLGTLEDPKRKKPDNGDSSVWGKEERHQIPIGKN